MSALPCQPAYEESRSKAGSGERLLRNRAQTTLDPWLDDPFPDYDTEPAMAFSAT
jgi:hypothetical protein